MLAAFVFCLVCLFVPVKSYVTLQSCPAGCECFERNTAVECQEAHLTQIPVLNFASEVKRLILRGNAIDRVEEEELERYQNLQYLDLSDNEISTLSATVFTHNPHLKEINLGLNPFLCNCDLEGFSKVLHGFIESKSVALRQTELMHCAGPQAFVGRPVLGIVFQEEYNKKREKERMYIGETENRGIAICPNIPPAPKHAKLKAAKPATFTYKTTTPAARTHQKDSSPNLALIIASITAGVLITCIAVASAVKHFLKKKRLRDSQGASRQANRNKADTFAERMKQQRRASRGYTASDGSSDDGSYPSRPGAVHTTYLKAKLNQQRRHSQGYTRLHASSGSASDLEDIELME